MRPSWFMENWAERGGLLEAIRAEGRVYSASGGGRLPWVSKTDIAACAYSALTAVAPPNGDYVILGPELLSYEQVNLTLRHQALPSSSYLLILSLLASRPVELIESQCADILSEVTGKQIIHVNLTVDELAERHIKNAGLSEEYAQVLASMDIPIKDGSEERLNELVLRVTGRKPKTFREFAVQNKLVWL